MFTLLLSYTQYVNVLIHDSKIHHNVSTRENMPRSIPPTSCNSIASTSNQFIRIVSRMPTTEGLRCSTYFARHGRQVRQISDAIEVGYFASDADVSTSGLTYEKLNPSRRPRSSKSHAVSIWDTPQVLEYARYFVSRLSTTRRRSKLRQYRFSES